MSWLNPVHAQAAQLEKLSGDWQARPNLRIPGFLDPERADELHRSISARTLFFHTTGPGSFRYQYWADAIHLDEEPDAVAASFAAWLATPGCGV